MPGGRSGLIAMADPAHPAEGCEGYAMSWVIAFPCRSRMTS